MFTEKRVISWLQKWFYDNCDGDWEHDQKVIITTIDNPGWSVEINLKDTELEGKYFKKIDDQISENDWIQCQVKDAKFMGAGGSMNLKDIIWIFVDWRS